MKMHLYMHPYGKEENNIKETNTDLREKAVRDCLDVDEDAVYELLVNMLDCAKEGLLKRGKGEEGFLVPLYDRCARGSNPGKEALLYSEDEIIKLRT